jgi:glucan exporter ATP-binding protein
MRRFFKLYGRTLSFLGAHRLAVAGLCAANVAMTAVGFMEPMLFGNVVQRLSESAPPSANILAWAALGIIGIVAGIGTSLAGDRLAHRLRLRVLAQAYEHMLLLPPAYHALHPTGGLMKTLWTGADEMFSLWLNLFREHLSTVLCLVGLLPVALLLNPALGAVLVALALVFSATVSLTLRRTRDGQRHAEDAHTAMSTQVSDVLGNARLIQAFGMAPLEVAAFGPLAKQVLRHQLPVLGWWAGLTVMSRAASTVATVAVVSLGAWLHGQGRASMADVVTFMGFAGLLIGRLESALVAVSRLGATLPRLEDFFAMLDTKSSVPDRADLPDLPAGPGTVEFRGVRFGYPGGATVLDGIDFVARPGETVALVGATGSGKSTAMALLQRLWDPAEGSVLVDGHDMRDVSLASLRDRIGIVPQETLLLNRTIGENLLVGRPGATRTEVEHAARLAEAHDFIMRQPQGYDTLVGERGAALSGGQRQRLAIARALLRDPRILILDEATSALDGLTEEKVVRAMKAAAIGRTTFVIAHRLATIRDADRILFFRDGVVAESGTFEELTARDGAFAELARTQFPARVPERKTGVPHIRLVYSRGQHGNTQDDIGNPDARVAEAVHAG